MITCYLQGGLGNQLFLIFTVISYSLKYNIPFYFPDKPRTFDRKFYFDDFFSYLKDYTKDLRPDQITDKFYKESEIFIYNEIKLINFNFCIYGYFQNKDYFESNKNKILEIIHFDEKLINVKNECKNFIDFDCSLHFRIGDAKISTGFIILDIKYYIDCLTKIDKIKNVLYFYEQEDIADVTNKISILKSKFPNLNFVGIDTNLPDYSQLLLMSNIKINIIANSTFSWWAAYLNKNQDKLIFYPSKYFCKENIHLEKDVLKLFPESWTKIQII